MILKRMLDFPNYGWRSAFDDLERMRRDMDRLFGQVVGRAYWPTHAGVFPLVNISEDRENFYISAELPGLESKEIQISASGKNLTLAGERKIASQGEHVKYHRREREGGQFSRVIALPNEIEADNVEATYSNGILSITVPKAAAAKPKQIAVK